MNVCVCACVCVTFAVNVFDKQFYFLPICSAPLLCLTCFVYVFNCLTCIFVFEPLLPVF